MGETKVIGLLRSQQGLLQEVKRRHENELKQIIVEILCELGLKEQIQVGKQWWANFAPDSSTVEFTSGVLSVSVSEADMKKQGYFLASDDPKRKPS
jgi:hypothetical protein